MILHRTGIVGVLERGSSGAPVFIATSSAVDRYGDLVRADGVDWSAWSRNPVVLVHHDHKRPVARGGGVERLKRGELDGWTVEVGFPPAGTSRDADEARGLVDAGVLRAVSIGFRPLEERAPTAAERKAGVTGRVFTASEILEVSLVSVPANAQALRVRSVNVEGMDEVLVRREALRARSIEQIDEITRREARHALLELLELGA